MTPDDKNDIALGFRTLWQKNMHDGGVLDHDATGQTPLTI